MASHQTHLVPPQEGEEGVKLLQPDQTTADYSTLNPETAKAQGQEIEYIETELRSCPYTLYKCFIIFALVFAVIAVVFSIIAVFAGMGVLFIASAISAGWNLFQLNQERKALRDLDVELAEKALLAFKYYIVAIPVLYLIFGIADGLPAGSIILSVILNPLMFYLIIFYPGQKVAEKLRRREDLRKGPIV